MVRTRYYGDDPVTLRCQKLRDNHWKSLVGLIPGPQNTTFDGTLRVQPRDLSHYHPSVEEIQQENNFRYRGFPEEHFVGTKHPLSKSLPNDLHKNFAKKHVFDVNKPTIDTGHKGILYGTDINSPRPPTTEPRPIRNPLQEKNSAELRKARKEMAAAEVDIMQYKQEKLLKQQQMVAERKKDLAMLQNYNPWGKPGHGAPKGSNIDLNKKTRMLESDEASNSGHSDFHDNFGKPGNGAPQRTKSGRLKTEIPGDPTIRFMDTQKGRATIEERVRYIKGPEQREQYHKDLDHQIQEKAYKEQEEKLNDLRTELMMLKEDPYGKPGAGAPNRYPSDPRLTKSLELSDTRLQGGMFDPWGKGAGQPQRETDGYLKTHKNTNRDLGPVEFYDPNIKDVSLALHRQGGHGGSGAPVKTDSGTVNTKFKSSLMRDEYGKVEISDQASPRLRKHHKYADETFTPYDPFGKSGAGAPLKDTEGHVQPNVYGNLKKITGEAGSADGKKKQLAASIYLTELQKEMAEQKQHKQDWKNYDQAPIGDITSVMKDKKVGNPLRDPNTGFLLDQHLPHSDITRMAANYRPQKTEDTPTYHNELQQAAEDRYRQRVVEKIKDKADSQKHQEAFSDYWGRAGGGAPTAENKKVNLEDALFNPRREDEAPHWETNKDFSRYEPWQQAESYRKMYDDGHINGPHGNYIRSTLNSKHDNNFELEVSRQRQAKRDYNMIVPYATVEK
ncbi:unnamed protein product [Owenia fusiformis]|uniref:Uncharacterized protein n=1 Tax=Owenia fusiformis TaxID=6347 RepID=A0A8S4MZI4_OWEFU|nr:unnamed protein product [Owenia fusiformis]